MIHRQALEQDVERIGPPIILVEVGGPWPGGRAVRPWEGERTDSSGGTANPPNKVRRLLDA